MTAFRRIAALLAFVALLAAGWAFAARNSDPAHVDYLVGRADDIPLWLALAAAFALGCLVAGGALVLELLRVGMVSRRFQKRMHGLEAEVHQLRNLPLATEAPDGPTAPLHSPEGGVASGA